MSFRKRSVPLSNAAKGPPGRSNSGPAAAAPATHPVVSLPGTRISPQFSLPTTSTGTASLDSLLGLGAGLALGTSLAIEEDGTTDYAGALLRCFAAEGLMQGHKVFVGAMEQWGAALPGLAEERGKKETASASAQGAGVGAGAGERMKIAWRYERLGTVGAENERRGPSQGSSESTSTPFSHTFDLTARLKYPSSSPAITYIPPSPRGRFPGYPPVEQIAQYIVSNPSTPVRLVLPALLSPLFYPPLSADHTAFVRFIHGLRSILRTTSTLTIMISWPLALYPNTFCLTKWFEHLSDGVISLEPFPHNFSAEADDPKSKNDETLQGLLRVRKLPILTERGMGVGKSDDLAFAVGRRRFIIRPFSLPPLEAEQETPVEGSVAAGKDLEF